MLFRSKPEEDPQNWEPCKLCKDDPGYRTWPNEGRIPCNGCSPITGSPRPGICLKWPTEWAPVYCDIMKLDEVEDNLRCYTLIVGERVFHSKVYRRGQGYVEGGFDGDVKKKLKELGITGGFLATVDYHC